MADRNKKVKGPDIYVPPLAGKLKQQWFTIQSGALALAVGSIAQLAAAHCSNERTLDPQ